MVSQTLNLKLTPMQIADAVQPSAVSTGAVDFHSAALSTQLTGRSGIDVLIYPKEPTEIVLQLENMSNRNLRIDVQVEGNFPSQWCRKYVEGQELAGRSQMEASLYFHITNDFFEEQQILGSDASLTLDYYCRVNVYNCEASGVKQLIESANLNLYVRPRSLYPKFLPAIYQEVDFIGRFLKIFEQTFEPAVQAMDTLWAYLDPRTAPQSMLPFLAHWVAWPIDNRWTLEQQRLLILYAFELYRWRGTKRGLRLYIHLYTNLPLDSHIAQEKDKHICIEEISGRGFLLGDTHLAQDAMIGGGRPYHFIVRLRPDHPGQVDEQLVRHIIDQEKPAFCTYELYIESSRQGAER
ncbi:MAG TPA: phage tail protein [Nostocaceae cyanobacterium]|nr:phage tail protein [Nostocaceae cyanobacterium]